MQTILRNGRNHHPFRKTYCMVLYTQQNKNSFSCYYALLTSVETFVKAAVIASFSGFEEARRTAAMIRTTASVTSAYSAVPWPLWHFNFVTRLFMNILHLRIFAIDLFEEVLRTDKYTPCFLKFKRYTYFFNLVVHIYL